MTWTGARFGLALGVAVGATLPAAARQDHTPASAADDRIDPPGGQLTDPGVGRSAQPIAVVPRVADAPVRQLSTGPASASAGNQVTREGATAEAATPVSRPAEGRQAAGPVRLGGHDRCDPRAPARDAADCARAVENRAADFAHTPPSRLSPEQRLLIDQRLRQDPGSIIAAARDEGRADPGQADVQALASVVLSPEPASVPTPSATDAATVEASTAALIVDAIVGSGGAPVSVSRSK